jgi:deoxyribodipyrimidine photo-lyase
MKKRERELNSLPVSNGPVIYWMSRDQRIDDNWAFYYAQCHAIENSVDLIIVFTLVPTYPDAVYRHYHFMLEGLKEVEKRCVELNIQFLLLNGNPPDQIQILSEKLNPGVIYTDFDPLKIKQKWKNETAKRLPCAFREVDSHNSIPAWVVSQKDEYSAATFRKKYQKLVDNYTEEVPPPKQMNSTTVGERISWDKAYETLQCDFNILPLKQFLPGYTSGMKTALDFINTKLDEYDTNRNNPNLDGTSNLSPWLHFGQISAEKIALQIIKTDVNEKSKQAFWNEIIIWKEVSDNYCLYNDNYDSSDGFTNWAKTTLENHTPDERDYVYSFNQFENGETHEELWNAAQMQLVNSGKIHSYMRMYWAKKILEWSKNYREAFDIAIKLNDKYAIDGRDPNGFSGVAWAIGGVHDHPWFERPVYGKIRYMNENGCRRKFDVDGYIHSVRNPTLI